MTRPRWIPRCALAGAIASGACMLGPTAAAQDKEQCAAAAEQGQKLRDDHKLLDGRQKFALCASDACPAVVRKDCVNWLTDIDARIPTVVFRARAGSRSLNAVRVFLDGRLRVDGLGGPALRIEPGVHKIRFESEGHAPVEQDVVINERERSRALTAAFDETVATGAGPAKEAVPPSPAAATTFEGSETSSDAGRSGGSRTAAFIVGGLGLLAAGGAAYFGITGLQETRDYHDGCAKSGTCSSSDVDATRTKFLIADISGGVAVVALGVATYLFFRSPSTPPPNVARSSAPRVSVGPLRGGGAAASVGGVF